MPPNEDNSHEKRTFGEPWCWPSAPAGPAPRRSAWCRRFERLGAVVKRDASKPKRPVIALRFGLRNPIPETIQEVDKDDLRLFVVSYEVTRVTNESRKDGDKPLPPFAPTAVKVTDAD